MVKYKQFGVVISLVLAVSLAIFLAMSTMSRANAQDSSRRFAELFTELMPQLQPDGELQIAIRLHTSIVEGENVLIVPQSRDSQEGVSRVVSEIGEDFLCFDVVGGSARFIECIPFSNIASVRYLVP